MIKAEFQFRFFYVKIEKFGENSIIIKNIPNRQYKYIIRKLIIDQKNENISYQSRFNFNENSRL